MTRRLLLIGLVALAVGAAQPVAERGGSEEAAARAAQREAEAAHEAAAQKALTDSLTDALMPAPPACQGGRQWDRANGDRDDDIAALPPGDVS